MPGCGMHSEPNKLSVARNPDKPTQNKLKTKDRNLEALGARIPQHFGINKEVPFLFLRKCPLFLKEKSALEVSCSPTFEILPTCPCGEIYDL